MKLGGNTSLFLWLSLALSTRLYIIKWTRAEGIFLKKPQNATIMESSSATFRCSVFNSSFTILWRVNGSDSDFAIFQDRGLTVHSINETASELIIFEENYHLIAAFHSEIALLVVLVSTDHNDFISSKQPWTTSQLSSYFTEITPEIYYSMTQSKQPIPSSPKVDPSRSGKNEESLTAMLGAVCIAILLIILAVIHGIVILILWCRRKRRMKGRDTDKSPETCSDIKLQVNVVYEHRKPLQLQRNPAYQYCHPPQ